MAQRARADSAVDDIAIDDVAIDEAVEAAVAAAARSGGSRRSGPMVEALARLPGPAHDRGGGQGDGGGRDPVDRALARALLTAVSDAWQRGWQPADVHRVVSRQHGRAHARLVAGAIGREAHRHPESRVPPRWRLQLDAIGAAEPARGGAGGAGAGGDTAWAVPWPPALGPAGQPSTARLQAVEVAVATVALVRSLPRLPRLGPIPGEAAAPRSRGERRGRPGGVGADPRVLHKVTALLAKAESTNFPDEAEALTAKAQQLMTRHAIDQAHIAAGSAGEPHVGGRRVGIDDPYAGARYLLLSSVADANRCRAVWTRHWGFSTVFGDEGDLDAVELLYTSLLVQATRAMVSEPRASGVGRSAGRRGGRAGDTRSFRQSFLVAFARRVGERLAQAAEAVTADEATRSTALVPLFEARRAAAKAALDEAFPDLRTTRMSARNAEGWQAGVRAADRAELDAHRRVRRGAVRALR
jgi:Protein of unknown function (DUF2786)